MTEKKRGPGRPRRSAKAQAPAEIRAPKAPGKVGRPMTRPESTNVTVVLSRQQVDDVMALIAEFDRTSAIGARHTRVDVLRSAITHGVAFLKNELHIA